MEDILDRFTLHLDFCLKINNTANLSNVALSPAVAEIFFLYFLFHNGHYILFVNCNSGVSVCSVESAQCAQTGFHQVVAVCKVTNRCGDTLLSRYTTNRRNTILLCPCKGCFGKRCCLCGISGELYICRITIGQLNIIMSGMISFEERCPCIHHFVGVLCFLSLCRGSSSNVEHFVDLICLPRLCISNCDGCSTCGNAATENQYQCKNKHCRLFQCIHFSITPVSCFFRVTIMPHPARIMASVPKST